MFERAIRRGFAKTLIRSYQTTVLIETPSQTGVFDNHEKAPNNMLSAKSEYRIDGVAGFY
jgi:hypothetical protein